MNDFILLLVRTTGLTPTELKTKTQKREYVIGRYLHVAYLRIYEQLTLREAMGTYNLNHSTYYNVSKVLKCLTHSHKYKKILTAYPKLIA